MTARISLNLGRTGGHRPPLQSEQFVPLGKAQGGRQRAFANTQDFFPVHVGFIAVSPIVDYLLASRPHFSCPVTNALLASATDYIRLENDYIVGEKGDVR